jgi:hypothetical protein
MTSGSLNKRIKEIAEQHRHLKTHFQKKTHATPTRRPGETNNEYWGHMI